MSVTDLTCPRLQSDVSRPVLESADDGPCGQHDCRRTSGRIPSPPKKYPRPHGSGATTAALGTRSGSNPASASRGRGTPLPDPTSHSFCGTTSAPAAAHGTRVGQHTRTAFDDVKVGHPNLGVSQKNGKKRLQGRRAPYRYAHIHCAYRGPALYARAASLQHPEQAVPAAST